MLHYYQTKPNGRQSWKVVDEEDLKGLSQSPTFISVLKVHPDPENLEDDQDPWEVCKFSGPMHFDLDHHTDINEVLDSSRELVVALEDMGIDREFIHCWLSGSKGVHITVPSIVFGIKGPTMYLPKIYEQIAKEIVKVNHIDNVDFSIYGLKRMWRTEGWPRPGKETYKVGVTIDELMAMDADDYTEKVSAFRPPLHREYPGSGYACIKAKKLRERAASMAKKLMKARKEAKTIPSEMLRGLEETPGCIQKLVTEGDCPDSNWNQAAMQLGAYIAARYEQKEEAIYEHDLIEPFLANVHSSSRPSEKERRIHLKSQIQRGRAGNLKLSQGGIIAVIGKPCGDCVICRGDLVESGQEKMREGEWFHKETGVRADSRGYWLVGKNSDTQITSFTFWPSQEIREMSLSGAQYQLSEAIEYQGKLVTKTGTREITLRRSDMWAAKTFNAAVAAFDGTAAVFKSDLEVNLMRVALEEQVRGGQWEVSEVRRIGSCGLFLERGENGLSKRIVPHYIESGVSITQSGAGSEYNYSGEMPSTALINGEYPRVNDSELQLAISSLMRMNDPEVMAPIIGWMAMTFYRQHLAITSFQFPILHVWGTMSSGKTSTAKVAINLAGVNAEGTQITSVSAENASRPSIREFISSSLTVPRIIEEFNRGRIRNRDQWDFLTSLLRSSFNQEPITLQGRQGQTIVRRMSAPIFLLGEQTADDPSLRERTLHVKVTPEGRRPEGRVEHHRNAKAHQTALHRLAKALLHKALNTAPRAIDDRVQEASDSLPSWIPTRIKFGQGVALVGLDILAEVMTKSGLRDTEQVERLKEAYIDSITSEEGRKSRGAEGSPALSFLAQVNKMLGTKKGREATDGSEYSKTPSHLQINFEKLVTLLEHYDPSLRSKNYGDLQYTLSGEPFYEGIEFGDDGSMRYNLRVKDIEESGVKLNNLLEAP